MNDAVLTRLDQLETLMHRALQQRVPAQAPGGCVELWCPVLSPRELEMLTYLVAGLTSQEIADHMVISERTVREHVSNILTKMMVGNRTTAITWALLAGLVKPEDVVELWRRYRPHLVVEQEPC
jgi:DNA-binding NarL/FixJ family response regulator